MILPSFTQRYIGRHYVTLLICKTLVVYRFYCMTLYQSQTRRQVIKRGCLLLLCEYQIYFIECVENIRIFMSAQHQLKFRCFNSRDEIYLVITKKSKFSFYFILF